jgi:hypothetical protein
MNGGGSFGQLPVRAVELGGWNVVGTNGAARRASALATSECCPWLTTS